MSAYQAMYEAERRLSDERLKKITELEKDLKDSRSKYYELRNAEVVRSEIDAYEDIWLVEFVEDTQQSSKYSGYEKSREVRRQKWLHILQSSAHHHVNFLRTLILLHGVKVSHLAGFTESSKQLEGLQGYSKHVELVKLKVKYLEQLKKDKFLDSLLSFIKSPHIQPVDADFLCWYQGEINTFAQNISQIYSIISDSIHNAKFDITDTIPSEYGLLHKPEYGVYINMIMSFYSVSPPFLP